MLEEEEEDGDAETERVAHLRDRYGVRTIQEPLWEGSLTWVRMVPPVRSEMMQSERTTNNSNFYE
jgi:hypothetical protein